MKTLPLTLCCGLSALALTATAALSQDRLTGQLSLTTVNGTCPSTLALADQVVPVDFLLPDSPAPAHPKVQNRFRFNYMEPVKAAHSVTITGQIADYGVPGCTIAFRGEGLNFN